MAGFKIATGYVEVEVRYDRNNLRKAADKAGAETGSRFSDAFNKRTKDALANFGGSTSVFKTFGDRSGKDFSDAFGRSVRKHFTKSLDFSKFAADSSKSAKAAGDRVGKDLADGVGSGFQKNQSRISEVLRSSGTRGGTAYTSAVRGSVDKSKGLFNGVTRDAERTGRGLSGIGSRVGRSFVGAFGSALASGAGSATKSFVRLMGKSLPRLTFGVLAGVAAVAAAAAPAVGAAIAGALTLGFAGGIGVLGVLAWKESEKVKAAFSEMSSFIVEDFKRVSAPMESVLVDLAGNIRETYASLSPSLEQFFLETEPAFKRFQKDILDGFAEWGPAIEGAGSAFSTLSVHLGPAMKERIAELGGAFEELFAAVERNPEAVTAVFNFIMKLIIGTVNVVTWLTETWGRLYNAWQNDSGKIRTIFTMLSSVVKVAIAVVIGAFNTAKAAFNAIRNAIGTGVNWIQARFNAFRSTVAAIWSGLTSRIRSVVGAVVSWVRNTFSTWVGWIRDRFNAMRSGVSAIWSGLTSRIRSVVGAVVNWVRTTFSTWVTWIRDKFSAMRSTVSGIWNGLTGRIRGIVRAVVSWVRNTFSSWVGWIYDKFNALRTNAANIWNGLIGRIRSIVRGVVNWVKNTFSSWVGWIYDKFNALRTNASNIWNQLRSRISSIVRGVVNWVKGTFTRWVGWIYDKFNALRTNASNIWNQLRARISAIVRGVVNWVKGTFTRWVGWIYDKFNALKTNASNIWQRFKDSIVDKVKDLKDRATDLFNDLRDNVIRAFEKAKDGVEFVWNKLKGIAAVPVKFLIESVYNNGVVDLWNKIAKHVPGIGELDDMRVPGWASRYATGGILPGYTPGKDVHTVRGPGGPVGLSGGEAIMRPEWTRAIGADAVHAMNKVARQKGVSGLKSMMGYADGGITDSSRSVPMGPTNPLRTSSGKLAQGWNAGHQGFASGGVFGWVKSKIDGVKDFASDVMGNITGWATGPFTRLFDMLKNPSNGGTDKKTFGGIPYHAGQHIWDKIKALFQSKDAEHNAELGGFGSFTYNGKPADLPGLRGTKPHVRMIGNFIASMFGVKTAYGLGGPPEHSTGRAIDYMVGLGSGQKRGDGISAYYLKHQKELALKWVIWRQRIYNVARKSWRKMGDRGNPTQNHFDHPHVFHQTSAPKARDFISKQKGVKFSGGGGGSGGSGNTMFTSFWDSHTPMANGKRMHGSAIASSVIPLGSKLRVNIGGKTATGSVDDLGPASFVYRRHHPKALLDLAEPMMQKLTGRRSNTRMGSFQVLKKGSGRTLFGYTKWNGVYDPSRGTNGFATGGVVGGQPLGSGSHDVGGLLPDKHVAHNRSGEAELVTTRDELLAYAKAAEKGGGDVHIHGDVILDAKNVKEIQDVVRVFRDLRKTGRANGGNVRFQIRD